MGHDDELPGAPKGPENYLNTGGGGEGVGYTGGGSGGSVDASGPVPASQTTAINQNIVGPNGIITGYTNHGIDQAIGRDNNIGVSPTSIIDTVTSPISTEPNPSGGTIYTGNTSVVILNPNGEVITTWPTGSQGVRCQK